MHLLVAISSHGFGHAAQVAPIVVALRQRLPALEVTLLSDLPAALVKERFGKDVRQIARAPDFGLVMLSPLDIDLVRSARAYVQLHRRWDDAVSEEARALQALAPDLLLADVPYLTLAAARQAGIPALALCSLNWADIYRCYFHDGAESRQILATMEAAYRSAQAFLCPEPSMPMRFLDNRVDIGPLAARGRDRRDQLRNRLGLDAETALVLVAPGGVKGRFDIDKWPAGRGIHWLVSAAAGVRHRDSSCIEEAGLAFTDLLASCDAVLGKCGYGTVTECVANATPLLYIPRPDWPEEPCLLNWLKARRAGVEVPRERLVSGEFSDLVEQARSLRVISCETTGIARAADILESCFH